VLTIWATLAVFRRSSASEAIDLNAEQHDARSLAARRLPSTR
jgi:hypothetical protein